MQRTKIEWATHVANFIITLEDFLNKRGWHCEKISRGCQNCWAERLNNRLGSGIPYTSKAIKFALNEKVWTAIKKLKAAKATDTFIFIQDMGDLFFEGHSDLTDEVLGFLGSLPDDIGTPIRNAYFQVLTKRPERLAEFNWSFNFWVGVTIEANEYLYRLEPLKKCNASFKFASIEPCLEQVHLAEALEWLDLVILGAETGPKRRIANIEWVNTTIKQCQMANVPLLIKNLEVDPRVGLKHYHRTDRYAPTEWLKFFNKHIDYFNPKKNPKAILFLGDRLVINPEKPFPKIIMEYRGKLENAFRDYDLTQEND